jgi:hypothetical protein
MYLQYYFLAELREVDMRVGAYVTLTVAICVCMSCVCGIYITRYRRVHKSMATKFCVLPYDILRICVAVHMYQTESAR